MESILTVIQLVLAVLVMVGILLQQPTTGLDGALGGGSTEASMQKTRRGFDKFIFDATIVLSIVFIASLMASLVL